MKKFSEELLWRGGAARVARWAHRRHIAVLAFHNVVPDDVRIRGDRGLHIRRSEFAAHLDRVLETHRILPLGDMLTSSRPPPGSRPRAAITFDDAYRGAMTLGLDELEARGLPCTVFVAPDLLGNRVPWWDLLAERCPGGYGNGLREFALNDLGGRQEVIERWSEARGFAPLDVAPEFRTLLAEELADLSANPLVALASHGLTHRNLAVTPRAELERELRGSVGEIEELTGHCEPMLAYPYGIMSEEATAMARKTYDAAFAVRGGPAPVGDTLSELRHALPRINIPPGLSEANFDLRVSGILGR